MPTSPRSRVLRAAVLAGLAAVTLSTHVFVAVDRVRVKIGQSPVPSTSGTVSVTTDRLPELSQLRPPFALIARLTGIAGTSEFSVAVDGVPACIRSVSAGITRRFDCSVDAGWNPAAGHAVVIQGPPTAWALEDLEIATHHGSTDGAHQLIVLPAASDHYERPGPVWVIAGSLALFAALLLLPAPPPLPRRIRLLYRVVAAAIVLELALSQISQWVSDYRIVLSAGTFTRLILLLLVPRLWSAGRALAQTGVPSLNLRPAARWSVLVFLSLCVSGMAMWDPYLESPWERFKSGPSSEQARARLFAELQPVTLANCEFQRFGEANDGGYLLCANLMDSVQSAYSYGISGYDQWGCDLTHRLSVPVHQYDCFNLQRPACPGGQTVFHEECVAGEPATLDGRPFDTPARQFVKNGDGAKRVVVKMDVEGAEWDTLLRTPDDVLQQIDQLTIELHGVNEAQRFTTAVMKLKQFFYVANLHFNNFSCAEGILPFPAEVYEVLFVSKRLAVPGGRGPAGAPSAMMTPNIPTWKDCQTPADLPPVRPS